MFIILAIQGFLKTGLFHLHSHKKLLKVTISAQLFFPLLKKKKKVPGIPPHPVLGHSQSFVTPGSNTGIHA